MNIFVVILFYYIITISNDNNCIKFLNIIVRLGGESAVFGM